MPNTIKAPSPDTDYYRRYNTVVTSLPDWTEQFFNSYKDKTFRLGEDEEEMMQIAITLARENSLVKLTGGPFGTAIYEVDTGTGKCKLFSIGVNQVVPLGNSTLHGEMTAIQFGQKKLNSYKFGVNNPLGKVFHLYTSCEPCCQCLGGILWSGVTKLVCSAKKEDSESIGFNEGPVFEQSYVELEDAGVTVVRDVLREEGARVLKQYGESGGVIY